MVCINRRDYLGSTLYSPSELKLVTDGSADECEAFLTGRGVEIGLFLDGLIDALGLPEPTPDGKEGGFGLMGWSLGNLFTLCSISAVSSLPSASRARLQKYMRRMIVFGGLIRDCKFDCCLSVLDAPTLALGIASSPELYVPIFDEKIPHDERINAFACWVSSYFAHGDLATHDVTKLAFCSPDPTRKSEVSSLSPEELHSFLDFEPVWRSDVPLVTTSLEPLFFKKTCNALFDPRTRSLWPNLVVWILYCDSSPGLVVHAAFAIEELAKKNTGQPVQFLAIKDAHHAVRRLQPTANFDCPNLDQVFWDEPEKALKAFDHCLRQ
jgi:hypothetical protein